MKEMPSWFTSWLNML